MLLSDLFLSLSILAGLLDSVTYEQLERFIQLTTNLRNDILSAQPCDHDPTIPPVQLSDHQRFFLAHVCDIDLTYIDQCWTAVKDIVWFQKYDQTCRFNDQDFLAWNDGHDFELSGQTLWPPVRHCSNPPCNNTKLLRERHGLRKVILFTLSNGARATYAAQLTCTACNTTYYPNYQVWNHFRQYYDGFPDAIQVAEHHYMERALVDLFIGQILMSWSSASNCARLYNSVLSNPNSRPKHPSWTERSFNLSAEHIWDSFTIMALLKRCERQQAPLFVPHTGEQRDRFTTTMQICNDEIAKHGSENLYHFCDKCRLVKEVDGEYRQIQALVADGICIGRPRCAYQMETCEQPLASNSLRFCESHLAEVETCVVVGCLAPSGNGCLTCDDPSHRRLEKNRQIRGKACSGPEHSNQSTTFVHDDKHLESTFSNGCEADKSEDGPKLKAIFGRLRTHAELVFHCPCGIMVKRATCYKAESLCQMTELLFWFHSHGFLPEVMFYDNNCRLYRYLAKRFPDFKDMLALPVDVFHWKTKHKKSDDICSYECSPYSFPELRGPEDGSWAFNSSIAEQNNVWLGGYHSILREMSAVKYDFFLNEIIRLKNQLTLSKLSPYHPGNLHF
ncbi:hypothetical protein K435DRAFT_692663 [Dendrothele bispora CBS 962.96]|uniref:CxC5 like cysteine cluster associated with KDZ domain-containing protein n=1 Tax=Dendrothele bispora (strain CBS 962.96) TaxID=1314807 RepID=A0A4S8L0J7_DENBC|nr:hypothetical protein K435DRAFT_692663 [Dendrothele bispora CBS 962.96]